MIRPSLAFAPSLLVACLSLQACAPVGADDISSAQNLTSAVCPDPMPAVGAAGTSLTPATDQRLWFTLHAVGTQNYVCNAAGTGWTFVGPVADLLNEGGAVVGHHYASAAGPTRPAWEATDGSVVVMARAGGVTATAGAIPWLLLTAVSHSGDGRFANVSSIQRLNTVGGVAPSAPCTAGAAAAVPYEADYFFYKTGEGNPSNNPQCRSR